MKKGFLFNNAYIYASEKERESMNKKPYYCQSAIVFLLIGLIFLLNGIDILLQTDWIFYAVTATIIVTLVFTIISSVVIAKNNKKQNFGN